MKNRNKRNLIIGILGILLVFVGIGYALLSTSLIIESNSRASGTWDIEIKEIKVSSTTGNASNNSITINDDKLGARVNNTFYSIGDSITYDVTVENKGSIDANISCILPTDTYFTYTKNLLDNTLIKASKNFKFQITITYNNGEPQESVEKEIRIIVQQDDGSGIEVSKGKTLNPNIDITNIHFSYNIEDSSMAYTDGSYLYNGIITYNKLNSNEKIDIYFDETGPSNGTNIFVEYKDGDTLLEEYILSNDSNALFIDECYVKYVTVGNKWAKKSEDIQYCESYEYNAPIYYEVTNLPVFSGNWVLDESSINDDNRGTYYLNVLIDVE